jgi:hypothetical protein
LKDPVQAQLEVEEVVYVRTENAILGSVAMGLYKLKESVT